ncbi:Bax inhibitor-1/YccA family protein [Akkermansia glycaniphila]|uniref:Bax inhibitor-1/YccA family protein n=1 Tax=Akkermansia glycaniphila TaxID=1679444 RepID=UPI001C0161AB|nr:Bax inhibitor-1/YccA family protein [Akkermansia glycaniphila]MBT9450371.1 Bax inhibitor-1/YccA family protein [Akkermansia glycaniphila]
MSDYQLDQQRPVSAGRTQLRVNAFLNKVYLWMAFGLLATALTCHATVTSASFMTWLSGNFGIFLCLCLAELGLVWWLSSAIARNAIGTGTARFMFLLYAGLSGVTLGPLVMFYTAESLTLAFACTAGTFGAMTIVGLVTKRDMSTWGRTLMMILIGLIIAMVVNMFVGSSTLDLAISLAGVLLFSILTAYDTQKLLRAGESMDGNVADKAAVLGALELYLDFINLFIFLLRLLGRRN